jgi:hypothetical protein
MKVLERTQHQDQVGMKALERTQHQDQVGMKVLERTQHQDQVIQALSVSMPIPGPGDTSLVCIHANTRTRLRPALSIFPPIPRPGWSEIFEMYQIQGLSWYVQKLIPDQHGMFKS